MLAGVVASSAGGALLVACRKDAPPSGGGEPAASAGPSGSEAPPSEGATGSEDGAFEMDPSALPGAEARRARGRADAGTVDPACEGARLRLLTAAVDPRCAVSEREWNDLVRAHDQHGAEAGAGKKTASRAARAALRQEARREGDVIVVSIVNRGTTPLVVPLRYHPAHAELAFSVLAEPAGRGLYELAPPKNDAPESAGRGAAARTAAPSSPALPELDAGASSFLHVHSAHIRLPPGGSASARLVIDTHVAKRLDRSCPDAGPGDAATSECLPARLPKGAVVLHVGQMVAGIDAGEPARVEWDAP